VTARERRARSVARTVAVSRHAADQRLAWYVGLGLMAVLEIIDWPVALVIAVGHEIAHRARTRALRELAEGIEAGA
jgi:hypothetical protein